MTPEPRYWLDDRRNVTKVFYGVIALCVLSLVPDLFLHKDAHFIWEEWFGFYGWYGFIGCVFLVLAAKEMRKLLMRDEDYYDD